MVAQSEKAKTPAEVVEETKAAVPKFETAVEASWWQDAFLRAIEKGCVDMGSVTDQARMRTAWAAAVADGALFEYRARARAGGK